MSTSTWLADMIAALETVKEKTSKFYDKGNSSAGSDARKALQLIKGLAKTGRDDIQATKAQRKEQKDAA